MLTRICRSPLALVLFATLAAPAFALDPEVGEPYRLRVVLRVAKHRLLTDVFKDRVERELRDSLQAALGKLAVVQVVREHPRLKDVEERGLQQALDTWKDVDGVKTHFVLIDFVDGEYELQARQHDGLTGQSSPLVRKVRLPDPPLVARTMALLIGQDFGPVGTVLPDKGTTASGGEVQGVRIRLKGAALDKEMLKRWVRKGEIFSLVKVAQGAAGQRGQQEPWAVLRVEDGPDEQGDCVCRLFHRHDRPLDPGPAGLGLRCLKLQTIRSPLRFRLVVPVAGQAPRPPAEIRQVHIRRNSFQEEEKDKIQGTTNADGFYDAARVAGPERGVFDHVAFVTVLDNLGKVQAQIPIALVEDAVVVIPVRSADEQPGKQLMVRRGLWVQQVYERVLVLADLFKELKRLTEMDNQRQNALEKAERGLEELQADINSLTQQHLKLEKDPGAKAAGLNLQEGLDRIQELNQGMLKLQQFRDGLAKLVKEENDPKRKELQAKALQGQSLEQEADFEKALELYEEVLKEDKDNAKLRQHYEWLKRVWAIKDDKHRKGRDYIYNTWPALDAVKIKSQVKWARDAFEACSSVGDTLSPQKLLKASVAHVAKLKETLAGLDPDVNEDDRITAKLIGEAADALNTLLKEVNDYLKNAAGK